MKNQEVKNQPPEIPSATSLEQIVANTCFCKLRSFCSDKNSSECMKHNNIYLEFMQARSQHG